MGDDRAKTICVVDDDDGVRDSIGAVLTAFGYAVKSYASATDLLGRPGAENADCLLLDMNMPGMTGLELLELLRSRGTTTPALLLTANGTHLNNRMARAGVVKIIFKPVSDEDLLGWIEKACAQPR